MRDCRVGTLLSSAHPCVRDDPCGDDNNDLGADASAITLVANRKGSKLDGTLTLAGKSYAVKTAVVGYPAGLYRADGLTASPALDRSV